MASSSHIQEFSRIFSDHRKDPVAKSMSETEKNEEQIGANSETALPTGLRARFSSSTQAQSATPPTVPREPDYSFEDERSALEILRKIERLVLSLESRNARHASFEHTDEDDWGSSKSGSATSRHSNSDWTMEPVITVTVNGELKGVIEKLCSKMNIRIPPQSLTGTTETGSFRLAGRLVRILRGELKTASSATETSEGLKESIERIISDVVPWGTLKMKHTSECSERPEAQQESEVNARVEFSKLREVFLPGELVYVERSELATDGAPGQCWRVDDCAYTDSETSRFLWIRILEWKWNGLARSFRLTQGQIYIEEYTGRVSFEELGVIPVAKMRRSDKTAVQERLVSRGKVYVELFKSTQSLWEYHGPVTRNVSLYKWFSRPMAPEMSGLGDATLTRTKYYPKV